MKVTCLIFVIMTFLIITIVICVCTCVVYVHMVLSPTHKIKAYSYMAKQSQWGQLAQTNKNSRDDCIIRNLLSIW